MIQGNTFTAIVLALTIWAGAGTYAENATAPLSDRRLRLTGVGNVNKANNILGMSVINLKDEKLGEVQDLVVDLPAGRVAFALVSSGGVFGIGDQLTAVPLTSFNLSRDGKKLVMDADKEKFKNAPRLERDRWFDSPDRAALANVYRFYDQKPYWENNKSKERVKLIGVGRADKASNLIGTGVINNENEKLGKVDDLGIDLATGRLAYVVLSSGGILGIGDKLIALPPDRFRFAADAKELVLNTTRAKLEAAPKFERGHFAELMDPERGSKVYRYHGEEPYWNDPNYWKKIATDNTGRNARDRDGRSLTPIDQSEAQGDLQITQQIRQAIIADKSLSILAQNVKIITQDGHVTLRGPVKSQMEKSTILDKVMQTAGVKKIDNQIEITTDKS